MLIKKDCTGKTRTVYQCDKCGKIINIKNRKRFKLSIDINTKNKTSSLTKLYRYDLCTNCINIIMKLLEGEE